jgi:hypothetical protein
MGEYLQHTVNTLQSDGTLQSTGWEQQYQGLTNEVYFSSLTAMGAHERPFFNKLYHSLIISSPFLAFDRYDVS